MHTERILLMGLVAAIWSSIAVAKGNLSCYEEPGTHKTMCINQQAITSNGDLRGSTVYSGGPNGVTSTSYTLIVDCKNGTSALQDAQGVTFGATLTPTATKPLQAQ